MRLLIFAWLFPIALSAAPPVSDRPAPALGDVYEYESPYSDFPCDRWTIVALNEGGMLVAECGSFRIYSSVAGDYNPVRMSDMEGSDLWSFSPYFPGIKFPLQVGANWGGDYEGFGVDAGMHWYGDVSCDVDTFEEVTVPAGTFEAYRISCTDALQSYPGRQPMGDMHSTSWYAPEVEAIVKVRNREDPRLNRELVSVERN